MKINVKDILRDVKMFLKTIVSEYQSIIEVVIKQIITKCTQKINSKDYEMMVKNRQICNYKNYVNKLKQEINAINSISSARTNTTSNMASLRDLKEIKNVQKEINKKNEKNIYNNMHSNHNSNTSKNNMSNKSLRKSSFLDYHPFQFSHHN